MCVCKFLLANMLSGQINIVTNSPSCDVTFNNSLILYMESGNSSVSRLYSDLIGHSKWGLFLVTMIHLLHVVGEVDQAVGGAGVGHHHQNLRAPELDVTLPDVQTEEVLAHLVVDESLRDVAPGRGRTTDQQVHKEKQHDSCVDRHVCVNE